MTIEEAFLKGASAVFERHKLAGLGTLLAEVLPRLGGSTGFFKNIGKAYGSLNDESKRRMWGQLGGGVAGALAGYGMSDEHAGLGQKLMNAATGATVTGLGGGYAAAHGHRLFA